jgi:sulfate transport system ATP-binding protein
MSIVLENLTKRYEGHPVVNNVSLEVGDGEFFVLLGSSGSGKTTVLNMIAGLTSTEQGRVLLHGRDVTHLPTQERRVGFVFQNYALFQHMTVGDNIEFGLRIRKAPQAERRQRRDELLELVGLAGLGKRMPHQLSGGQQQRVALARALAHRPDVLLLDEPLGALDAKIRTELRRTLRQIQQQLGIATILVTHDQEEAFELADRLGVMNFGRLLEVGPPQQLYQCPQTEFVATFLGTANLLVGQAAGEGVQMGPLHFPLASKAGQVHESRRVQVLFRPEEVELAAAPFALSSPQLGEAEVEQQMFSGSFERLRLRLPRISGVRAIAPPVPYGSNSFAVEATRTPDQIGRLPLRPGQKVWVGIRRVHGLEHPGLRFLILSDGSLRAQAALALGGQIARLAHARVTLLGYGLKGDALQAHLQAAKEQLGHGLAALEIQATDRDPGEAVARAVERQSYDLVICAFGLPQGIELAEEILQAGEHHLLLVPRPQPAPAKALICVTTGEPGKNDVLFAGRLLRHLGAEATLLSIVPAADNDPAIHRSVERFLENGRRSLESLGVASNCEIRSGDVEDEIGSAMKAEGYDLLVLGAPLADEEGRVSLSGVVSEILRGAGDRPVLVVRSPYMAATFPSLDSNHPIRVFEEIAV